MKLVSIIMATYNAESYICKCINSVLNQTYTNFELIIVDDCSTDSTVNIIDSIKDSRIRLYRNAFNLGAGPTRNYGLDMCRGEYVYFPDSDDTLDEQYIDTLVTSIENSYSDIAIASFKTINNNNIRIYSKKSNTISDLGYIIRQATINYNQKIAPTLWNKLYKKEIIDYHNIKFTCIRSGQDYVFNLHYLQHVYKMSFCNSGTYYNYYLDNISSITRNFSKVILSGYSDIINEINKVDCPNVYKQIASHTFYTTACAKFFRSGTTSVSLKNIKETLKEKYNISHIGITMSLIISTKIGILFKFRFIVRSFYVHCLLRYKYKKLKKNL